MDRANSKHSRRLDDEMARETLPYTLGSGTGSRTQEWRDPEPPGDGQPEAAPIPDIESEDEGLSRLGRFVPRTALPGDRDRLIEGARRMHATDEVLDQLAELPPGRTYATVAEVWAALGHSLDRVHR
jgi:hypothetical protein